MYTPSFVQGARVRFAYDEEFVHYAHVASLCHV